MSDLISREAAIEHLKKRLYETALNNDTEHPYYEEMADNRVSVWLEEVPSAQQWIPVSERLPDVMGFDERYLVSLAWGGVGVMEYKSTGFHNYGSFNPVPIETVTAWMPLPKPWRGEE